MKAATQLEMNIAKYLKSGDDALLYCDVMDDDDAYDHSQ